MTEREKERKRKNEEWGGFILRIFHFKFKKYLYQALHIMIIHRQSYICWFSLCILFNLIFRKTESWLSTVAWVVGSVSSKSLKYNKCWSNEWICKNYTHPILERIWWNARRTSKKMKPHYFEIIICSCYDRECENIFFWSNKIIKWGLYQVSPEENFCWCKYKYQQR